MTAEDRAAIGKALAGKMSVDEFEDILRRAVQDELAKLRAKVNQTGEEKNVIRKTR
jgi:hypothetical protein